MARTIDYNNLTADDLEYLSTRGWLVTEGDYQGFKTGEAMEVWRETGEVPETVTGEIAADDEGVEYKDASVADLKAELKDRGLPTDGKKDELVARLEAHDLETADEDDDEDEDVDA